MCLSFSEAALHTALEASVPVEASGLVVALSGGPDSAALLGAAAALGKNFRALPLRAVHIDHDMQAAAAEFREACKRLCDHLGIPNRKSTRLNSSHTVISYAVFCFKKKKK